MRLAAQGLKRIRIPDGAWDRDPEPWGTDPPIVLSVILGRRQRGVSVTDNSAPVSGS